MTGGPRSISPFSPRYRRQPRVIVQAAGNEFHSPRLIAGFSWLCLSPLSLSGCVSALYPFRPVSAMPRMK